MPNPPGLGRGVRLRRLLKGMRDAGEFDALDGRNGYALFLKLGLDAAPQLSGYLILARGGSPNLQAYRGSGAVKTLKPEDARTIDQSLGPCGIRAQSSGGGLQRLQCLIDGAF